MSEINVAAVLTPKSEKFEEAAALITEVIQKVQANEPGTLLYTAFQVSGKKEIVIVERSVDGNLLQLSSSHQPKIPHDQIHCMTVMMRVMGFSLAYTHPCIHTAPLIELCLGISLPINWSTFTVRRKQTELNETLLTPSSSILYRYKDQAAVQAHTKTPYFREFSAKIAPLMAKPAELRAGSFLNGHRGVSRL
ncbi:Ras-related C3 botulinum toxin substrate 1 [Penicillium diatomitis]|uniref:Ras-related C3 botulinum toxin substrate 1 n=1 Tax=Penicillium diatomitis TaxID=2819901 RepID=A0A9W9WL81_9EURO|nr:Ras-related C3 botulinum toxin substrate 1 [Penicillium diatomitis]KAJ5469546.1 Ras-related C3 botulinum toxin substrate 1 [Penicillium diatomitis]